MYVSSPKEYQGEHRTNWFAICRPSTVISEDLAKSVLAHAQSTTTKFEIVPVFRKMSCEPRRTSAYSEDLRWRMVWQKEVLGLSYQEIGSHLNVDPSTVCRTVHIFHQTGGVCKKKYPRERAFRKLTKPLELYILHLVLNRPGIYLRELTTNLLDTTGVEVADSTICEFLHRVGFTRQKMKLVAKQRDESLRTQYIIDVSLLEPDMFIFIDETGADRRDTLRKYGYSLRGKPIRSQKLIFRGERLSTLGAMSTSGVLDCKVVRGKVDADDFYDFIHTSLLPKLMRFNGINPNSVVILDNCAIHHVEEITAAIESVGALVLYLPPYSPDFMPIEELFSKVKSSMKALEIEHQTGIDLETIILAAFSTVTDEDCQQWISNAGIYNL